MKVPKNIENRMFPLFKQIVGGNLDMPPYFRTSAAEEDILNIGRCLALARCIDVDAVYAYYDPKRPARESLFPVFPNMWLEWNIRSDHKIIMCCGTLVNATRDAAKGVFQYEGHIFWYAKHMQRPVGPVMSWRFCADAKTGRKTGKPNEVKGWIDVPDNRVEVGQWRATDSGFAQIAAHFLWFFNIKNIHLQQEYFPDKAQKFLRKNLKPTDRKKRYPYYVVTVTKPGISKEAIKMGGHRELALHTVRGHTRTYDTKALFGKLLGTFFVPAHVRGDKKNGQIDKDYLGRPAADS